MTQFQRIVTAVIIGCAEFIRSRPFFIGIVKTTKLYVCSLQLTCECCKAIDIGIWRLVFGFIFLHGLLGEVFSQTSYRFISRGSRIYPNVTSKSSSIRTTEHPKDYVAHGPRLIARCCSLAPIKFTHRHRKYRKYIQYGYFRKQLEVLWNLGIDVPMYLLTYIKNWL